MNEPLLSFRPRRADDWVVAVIGMRQCWQGQSRKASRSERTMAPGGKFIFINRYIVVFYIGSAGATEFARIFCVIAGARALRPPSVRIGPCRFSSPRHVSGLAPSHSLRCATGRCCACRARSSKTAFVGTRRGRNGGLILIIHQFRNTLVGMSNRLLV